MHCKYKHKKKTKYTYIDCPFNGLNLLYQLIPIFLRSIHSFLIEIENVLKIVA